MPKARDDIETTLSTLDEHWPQAVTRIRAEIEGLRAALKPFANIGLTQDGNKRAPDMIDGPDLSITPADVRAARCALGEPQSVHEQNGDRDG